MKWICVLVVIMLLGLPSARAAGAYEPKGTESGQGLVIKPKSVRMAEQLLPAVKNGVCLPRDLVSTDPVLNEAMRSYKNGQGDQIPTVKKEVEDNPDCHELPYGKAILHDFNDQVAEACNLTPDMRAACYILAGFEHLGAIPSGTVLNVDGHHNVKFVCSNGEEFVFDKDGNFIANGINEGTFNLADPEKKPVKHIFDDMLAAVMALPQKSSMSKDEFYSFLEKYVGEHKITIPLRNDKSEEKVCRDDKSMSDDNPASGDKTETVGVVDFGKEDPSGKVGIKGWCKCWEDPEVRGARSIMVGGGDDGFGGIEDPTRPLPKYKYSYRFCLRCGKCRRPNLKWDDSSSRRIFDNQLEIQLAATNGLRTCDYVNARKDVERKFINIPDGQIVFPGKCSCKEPDPIRDGFMNNYVCVRCGLCYVPVDNTVPIGPTAREEWGLK